MRDLGFKTDCLVAKSCLTLVAPSPVSSQAPLSMGFPRQEYWSELLFLSPGDLPDPGIKPSSPALSGGFFTPEASGKSPLAHCVCLCSVLDSVVTSYY